MAEFGPGPEFDPTNGTRKLARPAEAAAASPCDAPAIDNVLKAIAADIQCRPEMLVSLSQELAARIATLTEGVTVALDAPLPGRVDL